MSGSTKLPIPSPISIIIFGHPPAPCPLIGNPGFQGTTSGGGSCITTGGSGTGKGGGGCISGVTGGVHGSVTVTVGVGGTGGTGTGGCGAGVVKDEVGGHGDGKPGSGIGGITI
jgi:hypothetical protein